MSNQSSGLQEFKNLVGIKFQLYNSLFTSLPFHRIEKTGIFLSLLLTYCEEGYHKKLSPVQIIEEFFSKHNSMSLNFTLISNQFENNWKIILRTSTFWPKCRFFKICQKGLFLGRPYPYQHTPHVVRIILYYPYQKLLFA